MATCCFWVSKRVPISLASPGFYRGLSSTRQSASSVLDDVLASGGNWERAFGGVLLIHVPEARAQEFTDRVKQLPGSPA